MDQRKIGEFLKHLRKNKGLTQEQLAEQFYVSSRTVSRWETGNNMPDLDVLIDLADFYEVDIREIIDGERKSEKMESETKETLKKVAEYAEVKKKIRNYKLLAVMICSALLTQVCNFLFGKEMNGVLYGIVPENICSGIVWTSIAIVYSAIAVYMLNFYGVIDKIIKRVKKRKL